MDCPIVAIMLLQKIASAQVWNLRRSIDVAAALGPLSMMLACAYIRTFINTLDADVSAVELVAKTTFPAISSV